MGCLVLVVAASLATCRVDKLITPSTADVRLSLAADTVGIADSKQIVAVVTVDGKQNAALRVQWSTSDTLIASVDSATGMVRGVARGTATITARVENALFLPAPLSVSALVHVVVPQVAITPDTTTLTSIGDTVCLTAVALDARDSTVPDVAPIFAIAADPDMTLAPDATPGCYVARKAGAPATIRAFIDIGADTATVTVRQAATTLTVAPDSVRFNSLTEQDTLAAAAEDARGNPIPASSLNWTSDDTLASVSAAGVITARGNGTTWVRATSGTVQDSVYVEVRQVAATVTVSPDVDTLRSLGAQDTLSAVVRDTLGSPIPDAAVSWRSLDSSTARLVDTTATSAVFEAVAEGEALVDVRGVAGGGTPNAIARLEVLYTLASVTISPTQPTFSRLGDTLRFSATGTDVNGAAVTNLQVSWSSSDPNVTIDSLSGLATAQDSGVAIIRGRHQSDVEGTATATVAPPVLEADEAVVVDSALRGSTTPVVLTRVVRNAGTGSLLVRARRASNASWLSVSPDTVTLLAGEPKSLQLFANPAGLADGVHRDTVVLEADGAAGSPDSIPVEFRIFCPTTLITLDAFVAGGLAADDCGARHRPSSKADFYGFTGAAGDTVTVTMTAGSGLDPFLFLLGPTGAVNASNDDCNALTRDACIREYALPAAGGHTIEAAARSGGLGPYTLVGSRVRAPDAPSTLEQLRPNGVAIAQGGTTEFTSTVFRARAQDANPRDTLRLQIEVRPDSVAFTVPTDTGAPTPNAVGGVTVSASAGLADSTNYHWRARTCDQTSRCGPWTVFGATPAFRVATLGPVLTVSPGAVRDSALFGSSDSIIKSLKIDNTGSGTFTWSAINKKPWLTVPASGSQNTNVSLTLKPAGLAAGVHEDTIVVTAAGALGSPDTIFVTFEIQQPVLVVAPSVLDTSANAGGPAIRDTLRISKGGTGPLNWTAAVGGDSAWLTFDGGKTSGSAPDELPLTITLGARPAGSYTTNVVITAAGASGSPATIPVTVTVHEPVLAVTPASVRDSVNVGATIRTRILQVSNAGTGTLTWTTGESPAADWLSLAPSAGSAGGSVTLTLDPSGLAADSFSTTVVVRSDEAINDSIIVPVRFLVRRPILNVAPDSVFDTVTVGGTTRTIPVTITNGNGGVLAWSAEDSVPKSSWLGLGPLSGGTLDTLMVTLDPTNLAGGIYRDTVIIRSDSATGTPRRLSVRFDVLRPPDPPTSLGQFRTPGAGGAAIGVGGVTTETSVVFKATVTDPDAGDMLRLELQVERVGTGFGDTSAVSTPVQSGQVATIQFGAPFEDNTGYHWSVRTCDQTNRCSAWVSFGLGNAETAADFFANPVSQDPALPTQLKQFRANGVDSIPVGQTAGGAPATVELEGLVTDPDPGDLISIKVEVNRTNAAFDGGGLTGGTGVTTGNRARARVSGLAGGLPLVPANYFWRAQACDQTGRCSGWASYGGNSDSVIVLISDADTDFFVP